MVQNTHEARIRILNLVLNHIYSHDWTNYDDFAESFVEHLLDADNSRLDFDRALTKCNSSFLTLNSISKNNFLSEEFATKITNAWARTGRVLHPVISFYDIFPDAYAVPDEDVKGLATNLDVPEGKIQQGLRDALREKGASPISRRGKDSALEISDIEHFYLDLKGTKFAFSVVVKGFRSLSKLNWESIAHQVTKAHQASKPDYILVLSAKEPVDGVITSMVTYGESVGNKHLVIFVPPMDVAKFLRWRRII